MLYVIAPKMIPCPFCESQLHCKDDFMNHVKIRHKTLMSNVCRCQIDNCSRSFNNFYAYKKHYFREHSTPCNDVPKTSNKTLENSTIDSELSNQLNGPNPSFTNNSRDGDVEYLTPGSSNSLKQNTDAVIESPKMQTLSHDRTDFSTTAFQSLVDQELSSFVSEIFAEASLPRSLVHKLISKWQDLYGSKFIPILKEKCTQTSNHQQTLSELNAMLTVLQKGFDKFNSNYQSIQYFQAESSLIKPQSVVINSTVNSKTLGKKRRAVISNAEIQIVPMKDVLKIFLETPTVLSEILDYTSRCKASETIISSIQCEVWQRIEVKHPGKLLLPLIVYFDDFEVNNPLGSRANIRKLGAVYFSIASIPPEFSSMLENIFLAQLHQTKDHKTAGNGRTFAHIIDQIKDLQTNGLTITLDGQQQTVYFALLTIIGDNLGMNEICGFSTSFNSENYCRLCTAGKMETRKQLCENIDSLRSKNDYEAHCKNGTFGIKMECAFNEIPGFHVIENASLDPMHDLFEGICRYEIPKILNILINETHFFSLEILNARLQHFDMQKEFGKNKPISIPEKALKSQHLVISASEMVFLIENLGILIGDLITINHEAWELYLLLREIVEIVMNPSITKTMTQLLETLLEEHHSLYMKIFAEPLKPKHHFLIHYPRLMRRLGPLKLLSCFRFEAKHKELKDYARAIRSRRNCAYSLALKHQLSLSNRFRNKKGFPKRLCLGPTLCQKLTSLPNYQHFKNVLPLNIHPEYILDTWVKFNGITYNKNMAVAMYMHDNFIVFGAIRYIIVEDKSQISFICNDYHTKTLNRGYCAYEVTELNVWRFLRLRDLLTNVPQNIHMMSDGNLYILSSNV